MGNSRKTERLARRTTRQSVRDVATPPPDPWRERLVKAAICVALIAATAAVFYQTVAHEFFNIDDNTYVYENRHVYGGLSWSAIDWAFSHVHSTNWHPLTTLSHMLDCTLYGLRPAGHHISSVAYHALAAAFLFLALRRLTGAVWKSAIVAGGFAIHPLHVESVAWVAERKDVLSGLFFALTLWAYAAYVEATRVAVCDARDKRRVPAWAKYLLVLVLFALGLLCKPMLVTLPFVLLLLDYWPLQRMAAPDLSRNAPMRRLAALVIEKLPLMALAAVSCIVTYRVQQSSGAISVAVPLGLRVQTALAAYTTYLAQTIWPLPLATPYAHVEQFSSGATMLSAAILLAITIAAIALARRGFQYAAVGWFWYLGMLVPVLGLVAIGDQSQADRYTYLPLIGIFIAAVWGVADLLGEKRRIIGLAAAGIVLAAWSALSFNQLDYWRDSETMLRHTLAINADNPLAETNLGIVFKQKGHRPEAIECFQKALAVRPTYYLALHNLGIALSEEHDWESAIKYYRASLNSMPDNALVHNNLGFALMSTNQYAEAQHEFEEALRLNPEHAKAENNLAISLTAQQRPADAIEHLRKAIALEPDYAQAHVNLGMALASQGDTAAAIAELQLALKLQPGNLLAHGELAKAYMAASRPADAAREIEEIRRLKGQ
jgi:Tfp pilus assembly protein PilF